VTIADTSGLLALFNAREPTHPTIRSLVENLTSPLVVSPFVVAELDYLVATRLGTNAEIQVLCELASGAYDLPSLGADDLMTCGEIIARYDDQAIGVTDASLVVLADRYETTSILTLDYRHFRVVKPLAGGSFTLPET
jgi:predicted nucleic acid-binding protein